ncbi:interleukin-1 family member A [Epinephelus lanceolatus]|uniref:interleukin-1 family member A n=1 Tax=Epinephelus lanceolatus TaxID=310571 RepID=UPI001446703A|nr:interleukin-1 family member A [Epinephelus lanceolatus]
MDLQDSRVKGGVLIVHQIHDGKHQYEVENVVKYKKEIGEKMFVRRGDKLMQINNMDLQDIPPEEFAQLLAKDNPMLTVHKASRKQEHTEQSFPAEDTLYPFNKESATLSFSMEMRREEDLEENGVGQEEEGKEDGDILEDVCSAGNNVENVENGERGDLFIISMKKTSISVVRGRGCNAGSPCQECHGAGCTFNDIVVVAESSKVVLVPRGGDSFKQLKSLKTPVEHVVSHHYLKGLCSHGTIFSSPNPADMTIYYYKSTGNSYRGLPVVLNISQSNCFLRCCKEDDRVFLQVETCEKSRLKKISKSDENALSFVFFMKGSPQRKFESALHGGWFIQIDNADAVKMAELEGGAGDEAFLFIIRK